jgi:hypothetical protein
MPHQRVNAHHGDQSAMFKVTIVLSADVSSEALIHVISIDSCCFELC